MQRRRALCRRLAQRGKYAACTVLCCLSVIRLGRAAALAALAWLQQQREEGPPLPYNLLQRCTQPSNCPRAARRPRCLASGPIRHTAAQAPLLAAVANALWSPSGEHELPGARQPSGGRRSRAT
jgi:hypothetical protein